MKVLLVEDDQTTRDALRTTLSAYHYTVDEAADGQIGLELATQLEYDLIVLDLGMPKLDGMSLCRQLRAQGCQTPILMLTVRTSSEDMVAGLDAGADDYMIKPYDAKNLLARLRTLLRRAGRSLVPALTWNNLSLDPIAAEVRYGNQEISLSPKEYCLLELFLRNPSRVFSRTAIIDHLWTLTDSPTEGAVTNLMKDLRRKLRTTGIEKDVIETVYGLGYRLTKDDKQESKAEDKPPSESQISEPSIPAPALSPTDSTPTDITPTDITPTDSTPTDSTPTDLTAQRQASWERGIASINQVRQRFRTSLKQRIDVLDKAARSLQSGTLDPEKSQQAAQEAHRLAGGLGTFGYLRGSEVARAIEYTLRQHTTIDTQQFLQLLEELQREISQPPASFTNMPLFADPTIELSNTGSLPSEDLETKVMIVDDDVDLLDALVNVLQPWGLNVTTLAEPQRFWEVITVAQPNLLVLDLEMPTVSGFELCEAVRNNPQYGDLPVLVATAHTDIESIRRVFIAGADDFIAKPVAGPELITRVLSRLERSRRG
jgi:DNA-binding response OmpR family regulator